MPSPKSVRVTMRRLRPQGPPIGTGVASGSTAPSIVGGDCATSVVPSFKYIVLVAPGVQPGWVPLLMSVRSLAAAGSRSESKGCAAMIASVVDELPPLIPCRISQP